jgi:hypothetical protein
MYRKVGFLVALSVGLIEQSALSAAPLVCPAKIVAADSAQVPQITSAIPPGDALDDVAKLNAVVSTLRTRGIGSAIIIDNLISAYCPVVAANAALNDQQKTAQMRRFASKIVRIVYGLDSGDDIILDVPFKPDVMNVINSKAIAERLAPEEWVANAVGSYLKGAR